MTLPEKSTGKWYLDCASTASLCCDIPVYANYIGPLVMTDANSEGFPICDERITENDRCVIKIIGIHWYTCTYTLVHIHMWVQNLKFTCLHSNQTWAKGYSHFIDIICPRDGELKWGTWDGCFIWTLLLLRHLCFINKFCCYQSLTSLLWSLLDCSQLFWISNDDKKQDLFVKHSCLLCNKVQSSTSWLYATVMKIM